MKNITMTYIVMHCSNWYRRVTAEQKGEQGDLIEDNGDDNDSGVVELNAAEDQSTKDHMYVY